MYVYKIRYLELLEEVVLNISDMDSMRSMLPEIIYTICFISQNSEYYGVESRLVELLRRVSNDIIKISKSLINNIFKSSLVFNNSLELNNK